MYYFTIFNYFYIFLFISLKNQLYFLPKSMFINLAFSYKKIVMHIKSDCQAHSWFSFHMSFLSFNARNIHETYLVRLIFSVVIIRKNGSQLQLKINQDCVNQNMMELIENLVYSTMKYINSKYLINYDNVMCLSDFWKKSHGAFCEFR